MTLSMKKNDYHHYVLCSYITYNVQCLVSRHDKVFICVDINLLHPDATNMSRGNFFFHSTALVDIHYLNQY